MYQHKIFRSWFPWSPLESRLLCLVRLSYLAAGGDSLPLPPTSFFFLPCTPFDMIPDSPWSLLELPSRLLPLFSRHSPAGCELFCVFFVCLFFFGVLGSCAVVRRFSARGVQPGGLVKLPPPVMTIRFFNSQPTRARLCPHRTRVTPSPVRVSPTTTTTVPPLVDPTTTFLSFHFLPLFSLRGPRG